MTVVYIASRLPYPLRSGLAIRQFRLLQAYATVARVRLAFLHEDPDSFRVPEVLQASCASVHPVAVETETLQRLDRLPSWRRRLTYLTARRPLAAVASYSPRLRDTVLDLASSADLVHVARLHMVQHVESMFSMAGRRPALVLDLDDVETVARARWLKAGFAGSLSNRLFGYYDLARLWAFQRRAMRGFDRVLVCSARDRNALGDPNVVVIPNGVDPPPDVRHDGDGKTILYCGQLSWQPNIDATLYLINEILPRVRRHVPDVRVSIVGSKPPEAIRALADGARVTVRADVPSMDEFYRHATLLAVPLRVGGGTRIKILEAFAHGVPVVSTSIGCEGLDVANEEHLLVEDDPGRFATRCVELLSNPDLRRHLAARAKSLVLAQYTWASITERVATLARELSASRAAGAGSVLHI
jgi:glycosyltransferase involved in cell wall biosynthesis